MSATIGDKVGASPLQNHAVPEVHYEKWTAWPVNWSAIWTGALSALAAVLVFGLIGIAIGAHLVGPEHRVVDLKKISLLTLAVSVIGSFLAFVIGGWIAGKVAGILHSEPAMLHGAIVWLTTVPLLVVLTGLGLGGSMGGWYAGLASNNSRAEAPYDRPEAPSAGATESERAEYRENLAQYRQQVKQWREDSPVVARNAALGALTALLLGLMGSVIGGWMASGEPMTLDYHRNRPARMVRV